MTQLQRKFDAKRFATWTLLVTFVLLVWVAYSRFNGWHFGVPSQKMEMHSGVSSSNVALTGPMVSAAYPVPVFNRRFFVRICEKSDVIVVGILKQLTKEDTVFRTPDNSEKKGQHQQGKIEVLTVCKGQLLDLKTVALDRFVVEPYASNPFTELPVNLVGLFFLKFNKTPNQQNTSLATTDPFYSFFPLAEQRPKTLGGNSPLPYQVAVQTELENNVRVGKDDLILKTLPILGPSPEAIALCKDVLAQSKSPRLRNAALAFRLASQNADAIESAIKLLAEIKNRDDENIELCESLTAASNIITVDQLSRLYAIDSARVHSAVASIIKETEKPEFASIAIKILKSNDDIDTKFDAVSLISVLSGIHEEGDLFDFRDHLDQQVADYLHWWEVKGRKRYEK